jgi:hypothetical protein
MQNLRNSRQKGLGQMILTKDNYYSLEADNEYMSCSLFQTFVECEARAMAKLRGEYKSESSDALLLGSYIHSHFEGTGKDFLVEHPEMFKKNGELYEKFNKAYGMIQAVEKSDMCMFYLQGEKEVPVTAELFGLKWKIRFDNYNPSLGWNSDLKTTKSITEKEWNDKKGKRVSFIDMYDYMMRAAVYSEVERIANNREEWLKFYLVCVSKDKEPETIVILMNDEERYREELEKVEQYSTRIKLLKMGALRPTHCMECDYCKSVRKQKRVVTVQNFEAGEAFTQDVWEI